jgi:hypothetical protein
LVLLRCAKRALSRRDLAAELGYEALETIVADGKSGGIGFRERSGDR